MDAITIIGAAALLGVGLCLARFYLALRQFGRELDRGEREQG
jgi:hypothetical protein